MKKTILLVVMILILVSNLNNAIAKTVKVNLIPKIYKLTFNQAMELVNEKHLLIKCLDVNSYYSTDGVGYGVSGYNSKEWFEETHHFQVFVPYSRPSISKVSHETLRWYSSLTKENSTESEFQTSSKKGLNHIHVSFYRDGILNKTGNYYLETVKSFKTSQYEIIKPKGSPKRINKFVQGESAEALFQLTQTDSQSVRVGAKVGMEVASAESSSEIAHADSVAKSVKVSVNDDGKSIMFPAEQPVWVITITEKLAVDSMGNTTRSVTIDKKEEMLLTITKIRPKGGEYKWQKR